MGKGNEMQMFWYGLVELSGRYATPYWGHGESVG